jgi:hypothetical protein
MLYCILAQQLTRRVCVCAYKLYTHTVACHCWHSTSTFDSTSSSTGSVILVSNSRSLSAISTANNSAANCTRGMQYGSRYHISHPIEELDDEAIALRRHSLVRPLLPQYYTLY